MRRGVFRIAAFGLALLLAACADGDEVAVGGLPIGARGAIPMFEDPAAGVEYTFRLNVGERDGETYYMMGRQQRAARVAFVVRDVFITNDQRAGVEVWLLNYGDKPRYVSPSQFTLHSPTGQIYSYDSGYNTTDPGVWFGTNLQPDERLRVRIFFRVGGKDITEYGWRLGFTARPDGLFATDQTYFVWTLPMFLTHSEWEARQAE